mmetsp:Transcript_120934/g.367732  ORF Transcript_120934/g.367732 Transcript_120934/m.367732 type:complete len:313 (+) Transcript_120934:421-1359(+)
MPSRNSCTYFFVAFLKRSSCRKACCCTRSLATPARPAQSGPPGVPSRACAPRSEALSPGRARNGKPSGAPAAPPSAAPAWGRPGPRTRCRTFVVLPSKSLRAPAPPVAAATSTSRRSSSAASRSCARSRSRLEQKSCEFTCSSRLALASASARRSLSLRRASSSAVARERARSLASTAASRPEARFLAASSCWPRSSAPSAPGGLLRAMASRRAAVRAACTAPSSRARCSSSWSSSVRPCAAVSWPLSRTSSACARRSCSSAWPRLCCSVELRWRRLLASVWKRAHARLKPRGEAASFAPASCGSTALASSR